MSIIKIMRNLLNLNKQDKETMFKCKFGSQMKYFTCKPFLFFNNLFKNANTTRNFKAADPFKWLLCRIQSGLILVGGDSSPPFMGSSAI